MIYIKEKNTTQSVTIPLAASLDGGIVKLVIDGVESTMTHLKSKVNSVTFDLKVDAPYGDYDYTLYSDRKIVASGIMHIGVLDKTIQYYE